MQEAKYNSRSFDSAEERFAQDDSFNLMGRKDNDKSNRRSFDSLRSLRMTADL
jgi:hypothetical protein